MPSSGTTLMEMYRAMHERFGHQAWWPGETTLEICLGAILTQNTSWTNVVKALANLKSAGAMSVEALHAMSAPKLAELIRPAGYYNIKAKRLKNFIAAVRRFGADIEAFLDRGVSALREELLGVNGIGRETADSIILYAAHQPVFVVDAYTCRVLARHGLIAPEDDYESVRELLESALPRNVELWNDFHAQFVAVGKSFCRPRARCEGCPLERFEHDPAAGCAD